MVIDYLQRDYMTEIKKGSVIGHFWYNIDLIARSSRLYVLRHIEEDESIGDSSVQGVLDEELLSWGSGDLPTIIGYATIDRNCIDVFEIFRENRKEGFGTLMVKLAEKEIKKREGDREDHCYVKPIDEAIDFWIKQGYVKHEIVHKYGGSSVEYIKRF